MLCQASCLGRFKPTYHRQPPPAAYWDRSPWLGSTTDCSHGRAKVRPRPCEPHAICAHMCKAACHGHKCTDALTHTGDAAIILCRLTGGREPCQPTKRGTRAMTSVMDGDMKLAAHPSNHSILALPNATALYRRCRCNDSISALPNATALYRRRCNGSISALPMQRLYIGAAHAAARCTGSISALRCNGSISVVAGSHDLYMTWLYSF